MAEAAGEREAEARVLGSDALPEPLRTLLLLALEEGATDVHLDPAGAGMLLRFRVDGIVHVKEMVSVEAGSRLLNEVRVLSGLGTERTFVPLQAQFGWWDGAERREVRVTIVPTGQTEAGHLRLLSASGATCDVAALGLTPEDLAKTRSALKLAHGLILLAGPTGAGKTTTLYGLASGLDLRSLIAVSVEDPVEFDLPDVRQVAVDERHGLTFYEGLRVLLRMDPDVILIGEIRDQQSAVTAARAALAGRLVLATIHAVDAATAIEALRYLSVPSHIVGGCLRLVLAQNLVRRVCPACARKRPLEPHERVLFERVGVAPPAEVRRAAGCKKCNRYGYTGRIGLFETAEVDNSLAEAIIAGSRHQVLRKHLRDRGVPSLFADGLKKVAQGITTLEELIEATWPDSQEPPLA